MVYTLPYKSLTNFYLWVVANIGIPPAFTKYFFNKINKHVL
jgi:hypothetical protein